MKALVKTGKGRESVKLLDLPIPEPKDDEVQIKVMACGICGTDVHIMNEGYQHTVPVTLGHEFTGIVTKVGKDVKNLSLGDQVVALSAQRTCCSCMYCQKGDYVHCLEKKSIGIDLPGAMAEYLCTTASRTFKVPDNCVGTDVVALTEPLACCVRAVLEKSEIRPGDIVLVSGPGVIGMLCAQLAKLCGAFVIMTGVPADRDRLKLAVKLGVDVTNDDPAKLKQVVDQYTAFGVDHVIECSGNGKSLLSALDVVRKEGSFTQVGMYGRPIEVPMDTVVRKELKVTAGFSQAMSTWALSLKLLGQGKINLEDLISVRLPLSDWEKGFELFDRKTENKIVFIP